MTTNLRKHVEKMLITLLLSIMAAALQTSKAQATDTGAAQANSGSVEQLLMQMERN